MRFSRILPGLVIAAGLAGCAEVMSGDSQNIAIDTAPKVDASCSLQNGRGSWVLQSTPGTATILRSATPLNIGCQSPDGWSGTAVVEAGASSFAYLDAVYDYPERITVALSQSVAARRAAMSSADPQADRARMGDDAVATRFLALRTLLESGLITREEYNTRRGVNLGAMLRYSMSPPAPGLDRRPPEPGQLVHRLRYLAAAYSEHSISAAEQAAERAVILEALLPASPLRKADPPPPIKDQLQLAAEVGRLERFRDINIVSDREISVETAKLNQLLQSSIAAEDAAARVASGLAMVSSAPLASGFGVALSTHGSEKSARRAWAALQKAHPGELGSLQLTLTKIPRPHRPSHYRITAGPLTSSDSASDVCKVMRRAGEICETTSFGG